MTAEELRQIKSAAVRIHSAAVANGKWEPRPEWESKLMNIVCDISRAVEISRAYNGGHADLDYFDQKVKSTGNFVESYRKYVKGWVEDCLADAVIDILDTVEEYMPEWSRWADAECADFIDIEGEDKATTFPKFCFYLTREIAGSRIPLPTGGNAILMVAMEYLRQWSEAHGIDLRRHVQLKMRYNETRR